MKNYLILFLIIFSFISCYKKEPTLHVVQSKSIPQSDSILVFTPNNYEIDKKYPLVILLHGWSGDYKQWNSISDLQEYSNIYNFIIASPDGFYNSWYLNSPILENSAYENYFINEFLPFLKRSYSIDTTNIFISGLSMGGHGAFTLFLKNSHIFKSAASTSGILDLTQFPDNWEIKEKLGSYDNFPENWQSNSAIYLLDSFQDTSKSILLDCGTEDFAYEVNLNFAKRADELGIKFKFISIYGAHTRDHWKKMLPIHLEFFSNQL